jgi:hypothetical protein
MKKIIIAFDGTQFSEGAFYFVRQLNQLKPILLTGLFVPQVSTATMWSFTSAMAGPTYNQLFDESYSDTVLRNIEYFEWLCIKNNIEYRIHKSMSELTLTELKKETRFSDLFIISGENFYKDYIGGDPGDFMKDLLHEAECPVMIMPEVYHFPKRNVIAYDGSESSVYALKQFAYLFPELGSNETLVVFSKEDGCNNLPSENQLEELASKHFSNLKLLKLNISPKKDFANWLKEVDEPILLICGSFSRSALSQFFFKSFVNDIIAEHRFPVFIAHK